MQYSDFNETFKDPMMYKQVNIWLKNKIPIRVIIKQAILNNNFYIIDYLISKGLNINGDNDNFYKSFIHDALIMNNFYMASKLILKGAKINYNFDYFQGSLLYYAMFIKKQDCYDNSCQYYKRFPTEEQIKLIYLLIRKGIKLFYKDTTNKFILENGQKRPFKWNSPYEYAIKNNYPIKLCNLIYNEAKKQGSKEKYLKHFDPKDQNVSKLFKYSQPNRLGIFKNIPPEIRTLNDNLPNIRNVFENNLYVQNNTYNVPTFNEMIDIASADDFDDKYHYNNNPYNKPYKPNRKDDFNNKMFNMFVNPFKSYYNFGIENTTGLKNRPISQSINKGKDLQYSDYWATHKNFVRNGGPNDVFFS